jgi:predicted nucleotidyltransferase
MDERAPDKIVEISKRYLALLIENNIQFTRAYLFGSYLKGKQNEFSDIDIAIFSEKWLPSKFDALQNLLKLRRKVDIRVEPHPFEENEEDDPIVLEILRTGKEIVT